MVATYLFFLHKISYSKQNLSFALKLKRHFNQCNILDIIKVTPAPNYVVKGSCQHII